MDSFAAWRLECCVPLYKSFHDNLAWENDRFALMGNFSLRKLFFHQEALWGLNSGSNREDQIGPFHKPYLIPTLVWKRACFLLCVVMGWCSEANSLERTTMLPWSPCFLMVTKRPRHKHVLLIYGLKEELCAPSFLYWKAVCEVVKQMGCELNWIFTLALPSTSYMTFTSLCLSLLLCKRGMIMMPIVLGCCEE